MKQIFYLSKQNIELAKAEILSLLKPKEYKELEDLLMAENDLMLKDRLGLTHSVYKFLFRCKEPDLPKKIDEYDWQSLYKENFSVRTDNSKKFSEREVSTMVWKKLKNPKVKLRNAETQIMFFFRDSEAIASVFLYDIDKSQFKRKSHMRPELHPTSLHPSIAKACINITGLFKGTILDPFCGSGGILIEAGLMNFEIIGYDIDGKQLERAEKNLKHYGIKKFHLEKKDATLLKIKTNAIVTDLPYGKSSKAGNLEQLYEKFLFVSHNVTNNMVIIFPDFVDYKNLIKKSKWRIKDKFEIYIHKSLTRIIVKLI
ncbi:MAG: DNA methyltransferase [Nanoarchaeota archaeon]